MWSVLQQTSEKDGPPTPALARKKNYGNYFFFCKKINKNINKIFLKKRIWGVSWMSHYPWTNRRFSIANYSHEKMNSFYAKCERIFVSNNNNNNFTSRECARTQKTPNEDSVAANQITFVTHSRTNEMHRAVAPCVIDLWININKLLFRIEVRASWASQQKTIK